MGRRIFRLLFISCVTLCAPAIAGTVTDDINENTTWKVDDSPYTLAADVNICAGVTLTIEPNVEVDNLGDYQLRVYGTVEANGVTFLGCPVYLHETGRVALSDCNFSSDSWVQVDVNGLLTAYDSDFTNTTVDVNNTGVSHFGSCNFEGHLHVRGEVTTHDVNFVDTDVDVAVGGHVYLNGGYFAESTGQAQIEASGTLTAYDANFVDANVNACAGGVFDLIGCDFRDSTVDLRAGSTSRMKYCCGPNSVFYIDCDAHILIAGNDFSAATRIEAKGSDSGATISLEFNWWGGIPDYNDTYLSEVNQIILDHYDDWNLPYIDFEPFLPELPPQEEEDAGGELQGRVFFYFNNQAHPLPFAQVSVEGAEQPVWITDHEGKFGFSGVDPGQRTITIWHSYYYIVSKEVLIGEKSTTFLYVVMTPRIGVGADKLPLGGSAVTVDSNNPAGPNVVEIRSKHFGPYRHTYYLDGVPTRETITVTVDWGSPTNDPNEREVRWWVDDSNFHTITPVSDDNDITYESYTFDLDSRLATGQQLRIDAVDTNTGSTSSKETANLTLIDAPPGVPTALLKADTSEKVISYRILGSDNWALNGLLEAVDILNRGIPGFGGHRLELAARAYATGEIRGDGTASATFLDEHNFYPMEIDGIEIAPSASIVLGWDYNDPCDAWDPWGKLGVAVEGSYTSDPTYTIVMVGPVPVPVYWRTALRLILRELWFTLTGWNDLTSIPEPKWRAAEMFIFETLAELMLGAGIADHLAVEGFFGGGTQMYICNDGSLDDLELKALYLKLYGGIRVAIFIYEYEKEGFTYRYKVLDTDSCCDSESLALLAAPVEAGSSEPGSCKVQDRDYLLRKEGEDWVKRDHYGKWIPELPDPNLYLQQVEFVEEEELLQYNVFGRSQPSIAADGDDLFLAWVWDNPNRDPCDPNSLNRTVIQFSKYDSGTRSWSDPCAIWQEDNTADFSPQIATLGGGTALCVWENVGSSMSDPNLAEMAAAMDIAAAYYDGSSWQQQQNLTAGNGYLDRSPRLAAAGGKAIAVWLSNQQNDLGIDPCSNGRKQNDIWYSRWEGAWDAATAVANSQGLILKTALAYNGSQGIYVYEVDNNDANLGTDFDRELYAVLYDGSSWSDPCQLTDNNVPDTNPQVMYDDNGDILLVWSRLAWWQEVNPGPNTDPNKVDMLIYSANIEVNGSGLVLTNAGPTAPPAATAALSGVVDFRLANSDDGRVSLVWADWTKSLIDSNGIDILTVTRDPCLGLWSLPYQLTSDRAMEHSLAAAYAGSGEFAELTLVYNKVQIDINTTEVYTDDFNDSWYYDPNFYDPCEPNAPFYPFTVAKPEPNRVDLCLLRHGLRRDLAVGPKDIFIHLNVADVTFDWKVDLVDFAGFADNWQRADCNEHNFWCYDCDFDRNGLVDYNDLASVCQGWLWYSGGPNPPPDSTVEVAAVVHNVGDYAEVNVPVVFEFSSSSFAGNILYWNRVDTNIAGPIVPGGSGMAMAEWTVPPIVISPPQVRVFIDPDFRSEGKEDDSGDNQSSNELLAPDLTVTQVSVKRIDPNLGLTARVSNIGGVRADDVNVVVCYGQESEPNYAQHVTSFRLSLDPDSFYDVRHLWDALDAPSTNFLVYVIADPNSTDDPNGTINEYDEDNNMDFILVRRE